MSIKNFMPQSQQFRLRLGLLHIGISLQDRFLGFPCGQES
jgi:hypothetical protein